MRLFARLSNLSSLRLPLVPQRYELITQTPKFLLYFFGIKLNMLVVWMCGREAREHKIRALCRLADITPCGDNMGVLFN